MKRFFTLPSLLFHRIFFLFYLYKKTDFNGCVSGRNFDIIVWTPIFNWKYFLNDRILLDFACINSLSRLGVKFKRIKSLDIGKYSNEIIFLPYDKFDKLYSLKDYTKQLFLIICELEKNGNTVFPTSHEYLFWENKSYMYEKFKELEIPHPKTLITKSKTKIDISSFKFPFLIKEAHSFGSIGVHKVSSEEEFQFYLKRMNQGEIIIQELLNIRKDLRVTFVGNEIVHFYWRINNDKDWKPTSTSHGSSIDFNNFPEYWREFIVGEFLKLNLTTGAFDVAWDNDDLTAKPLILEVSPSYQLNPLTTKRKYLESYGKFKKNSIFGKEGYFYQYIIQTFKVVDMVTKIRIARSFKNSDKV